MKLLPHPRTSLALGILWLVLAGSMSPAQLLLALLLAWGLPLLADDILPRRPAVRRVGALLRLIGMAGWDVLRANLLVARLVLGPVQSLRPGFVQVPLCLREPGPLAALAACLTLTPGSVSVALSPDRRELTVHFLHLEDPEREVQDIKNRYEKTIAEVFGCSMPQ